MSLDSFESHPNKSESFQNYLSLSEWIFSLPESPFVLPAGYWTFLNPPEKVSDLSLSESIWMSLLCLDLLLLFVELLLPASEPFWILLKESHSYLSVWIRLNESSLCLDLFLLCVEFWRPATKPIWIHLKESQSHLSLSESIWMSLLSAWISSCSVLSSDCRLLSLSLSSISLKNILVDFTKWGPVVSCARGTYRYRYHAVFICRPYFNEDRL